MDKKHIPWMVGAAAAGVLVLTSACCCGGGVYLWPAAAATKSQAKEMSAEDARDLDAELELLPRIRTGMTREQAKGMLMVGTLKEWKLMSPEGHIAICRLAARRLHPTADETVIVSRSDNYVKMLDEMVYSGKHNDKEKIGGMIAFEDGLYRVLEQEEAKKK